MRENLEKTGDEFMGKLFGTDGVRGVANKELTAELAFKLGRAAAHYLTRDAGKEKKPVILIGRDTRLSGDMLEAALVAGNNFRRSRCPQIGHYSYSRSSLFNRNTGCGRGSNDLCFP